jgi:hypothetical protein
MRKPLKRPQCLVYANDAQGAKQIQDQIDACRQCAKGITGQIADIGISGLHMNGFPSALVQRKSNWPCRAPATRHKTEGGAA